MVSDTADGEASAQAEAKARAPSVRPFSAFERMVGLRYLQPRRKEAFISVMAILSFLSIVLGVSTRTIERP